MFAQLCDLELSYGAGKESLARLYRKFPDARLLGWMAVHRRETPAE